MNIQVAIDGPAGAGKSTVAQSVAMRLQLPYIDSGAMYRSVTLLALRQGAACDDEAALADIAASLPLRFMHAETGQRVLIHDHDVTELLRSSEVSALVPVVAKLRSVRERLVAHQRSVASSYEGVVMDGRDIGTHVLPHADVKLFLTASVAERARRRYEDMVASGFLGTLDDVLQNLVERDHIDGSRDVSPLRPAADAVILDTSCLTIAEVAEMIVALCETRWKYKEVT